MSGDAAVIVLSGPPATGKTTLARGLAERMRLPLLSRDVIKEALSDTLGWEDRLKSKQLVSSYLPTTNSTRKP